MNNSSLVLRILVFAVAGTILHGLIAGAVEGSVDLQVTSFAAAIALGTLLALIARSQPGSLHLKFATQFVLLFAVLGVNTGIELYFFSNLSVAGAYRFLAFSALFSAVVALLSCSLFGYSRGERGTPNAYEEGEGGILDEWRRYLRVRRSGGWVWRAFAGMCAYMVLYLMVGAVAFQYTGPYYTDPSYGLGLTVPAMSIVVSVQVFRSLVFVLALWPLLASVNLGRLKTSALGGAALFVTGGLFPLLLNSEWPGPLRLYHTVEILFQNAPGGFAIVWLIWPERTTPPKPPRSERRLEQPTYPGQRQIRRGHYPSPDTPLLEEKTRYGTRG
jgi:hypothetical protein